MYAQHHWTFGFRDIEIICVIYLQNFEKKSSSIYDNDEPHQFGCFEMKTQQAQQ